MQSTIKNTTQEKSRNEQSVINAELSTRQQNTLALAGLFGFFSRCIEQEIDARLLATIREELKDPLSESGLQFDDVFLFAPEDELVDILAEEFTALFVAPGCISPYASVFETGTMFKEQTDKAILAYHQAGWDYKHRYSGEFPDHIGTMLGFYSILCARESEFLQAGEIETADKIKAQRQTFLIEQLGNWGPGWCHLASQAATIMFYKQILSMIEQMLWSELSQMVDRRELRKLVQLNKREPKRIEYDADFRKASGL